jgi:SAM-dependent methyltransferase
MRMKVDFGRTAADYAAHRAAYPDLLYERLAALGIMPQPGSNAAVDLATGTGMIARALARRGWAVTALDIAPAMIASAAALAQAEGVAIDARVAPAENTDCATKSFDLATAFCCWHWFDREAAAREVHRVLKPGGRLVVGALDFHRAPGNVIELSSALIKQHNPEWTPDRLGFRLSWADELPAETFAIVERHDELMDIPYSQEAWCGRIRASAGVSASMAPEVVATFDRAHAEQLRQTYGGADLNVPHRLAYFIAQAR